MKSLVLLMIETEQPEALSARKLVVETAKHNVLTAYNCEDGLNLLQRFQNVDAVMVHGSLLLEQPELLAKVKALAPEVPIIVATPYEDQFRGEADYFVDSHQPRKLLDLLEGELQG